MPRKKTEKHHHETAEPCRVDGCAEPGEYKAPKSKEQLRDYEWYCLEHIREYNKGWDYLAGLNEKEIEAFIKDATVGHRPTWTRESHVGQFDMLHHALDGFLNFTGQPRPKPKPVIPAKVQSALALLKLDYPYTAKTLKSQYRQMVKKHHPDVNKGDKKSEETFKKITVAYHTLSKHRATPINC